MTRWTVESLHDRTSVADTLAQQQLSRDAAVDKSELFRQCCAALADAGVAADASTFAFFVPGRIEVLGKHTDYAGGRSIVAAVERGFCVAASPRSDQTIRVIDAAAEQQVEFPLQPDLSPTVGHWSNYPMTVARRVARNFPGKLCGVDIALASDLPAASGMSSSSAMIVSCFLVLSSVNDLPAGKTYAEHIQSCEDLAGYLGTIENGQSFGALAGDAGVGTFGGSEDHTAILCAQPGGLSQYSYCPVRFERQIRLDNDYSFVIAFSGVAAEKTGPAKERYNRVSRLASAAMEVWREETGRDDPHFAAALRSSPDAYTCIREALRKTNRSEFQPQELLDRFEQFFSESDQIIPSVAEHLTPDAMASFGKLVNRSQTLGTNCLKNQTPETLFLVDAAHELRAIASSGFGAGFGGSVWSLVRTEEAAEFAAHWSHKFSAAFPARAAASTFFASRPGPGAFSL